MLEANRLILDTLERRIEGQVDDASSIEGRVVIEPGARIEASTIRGPAIIGAGAVVSQSYVGPFTALMRDVQILGSEIEHSIVLEGSSIVGLNGRLVDSLVGRNVKVVRQPAKPLAYRLMVGDNSEIGIPQ
jgi:glucose-1-phosphate thymidylyltransferase